MIGVLIIACEIGFWAFVAAGLFCRYILKAKQLGAILLICTPLIDLVLLAATAIDLRNGATANFFHGLAAVYIGVSVAFGRRMIRWADERFAHRFAGGPKPSTKPKYGKEHARHERQMWYFHLLAWGIGCALLGGLIWIVGDFSRTSELAVMVLRWSIILLIDFLWSFSYSIWPRKKTRTAMPDPKLC
jgi:hypothetical protein